MECNLSILFTRVFNLPIGVTLVDCSKIPPKLGQMFHSLGADLLIKGKAGLGDRVINHWISTGFAIVYP